MRLLQQPGFNSTLRLFTPRVVSVQLSCLLSTVLTFFFFLNGYKPEKYILNDTCNSTEFNLIFLLSYSGPFTDFHMTLTG